MNFCQRIFRIEEVTGVWMDCDTNIDAFDRCLFHQATDDDFDFDQNGVFSKKGSVKIKSVRQHQWGPRCLSLRIQAEMKITVNVIGSIEDHEALDNTTSVRKSYYNQTFNPEEETIFNLLVEVSHSICFAHEL